ncbi:MAG: amylo-alpha-1,6-glucosidase [Rhizobacter sp.]|nr:amylo-alpha-1,6-glucosidase [Rhizobacter sp.]
MNTLPDLDAEWLESDRLGGFASGTVGGHRTRRYHALLLTPQRPPADRVVLVNGFEAWVEIAGSSFPLSTQHYAPDVTYPRGIDHLVAFSHEPWPRWRFHLPGGETVTHECVVDPVDGSVVLAWRLEGGAGAASLSVRPLLSGRDYHALMHENASFSFDARASAGNATWRPYAGLPAVAGLSNGRYVHEPQWFRNFFYAEEAARGLDAIEDLASPGGFHFDLGTSEAVLVLRAGDGIAVDAAALSQRMRRIEAARRRRLPSIDRAAEAYVVRRGQGHTLIAGFPWFTDWGRDTFIAMRGLVLARGRFELAGTILDAWAGTVAEGMLPNRFPDHGETPEFNAVDASLWYVIAVHEFIAAAAPRHALRERLLRAVDAILDGYVAGTRFGIGMDSSDGLIACGVPGVQLTWMDAKTGDHVVTPRIGKPVEIQALWINALRSTGGRHAALADPAQRSFAELFWNADAQCLYDVIDADHVPGRVDASVRPNQIFAVGGLPFALLDGERAAAVVAKVEAELLTPMGLRSLARSDPAYLGTYAGNPFERDSAYHQGTVWPWLIGPFVDAWLRVKGDTAANRKAIRERCLATLLAHREAAGLGHVSEIADGDAPHTPRGCPFQAWSLGELIRALARTETEPQPGPPASGKARP